MLMWSVTSNDRLKQREALSVSSQSNLNSYLETSETLEIS